MKSDCFLWAGVTGENGVQVYKDVAAANSTVKLYGPDGVTEEAFTNPKKGGVPASVGKRVKLTVATLGSTKDLPAAAPVLAKYKSTYKTKSVDPYAIYGYETMALALDVLKRAGDKANDREQVREQLFEQGPQERPGHVLDRRERRHDADRLRPVRHQGRPAELLQEDRAATS